MRRATVAVLAVLFCPLVQAKTLTYNQLDTVNLRDAGLPADERETNVLVVDGDAVFGATSGDQCHVFRFQPSTQSFKVLITIPGPNTVMRGLAIVGDDLYVGTMWTPRQVWFDQRARDGALPLEEANLLPIKSEFNTGLLYRVRNFRGDSPAIESLPAPMAGQGIHTLAADDKRGLLYGVTAPGGQFFVFDTKAGKTEHLGFGKTFTTVSNHMVGYAEVDAELADLIPGEGEWNNRLIPMAMHVASDGCLYTSGGQGKILRYNPDIDDAGNRWSEVGWIPSVPGRQYWNRIDAIVERDGKLYMGTSDGYVVRVDPATDEIENLGKPIRAIEVMGMVFSPIDGQLYGVSGGWLEGMSRFWSCDVNKGTFEVDYPAVEVLSNRRRVGDLAVMQDGSIVMAQAFRVADLLVLTPGEAKPWEKSGQLEEVNPQEARPAAPKEDRFTGHKKIEVDIYPIPSSMHGGSGYTAIQADRDGRVYVGTAYYGKHAELVQLDPGSAQWRSIFKSDGFTHQYGRGQGIPGKIHTKLRLGADGKIYGAMKQGYEFHYALRPDVGEAPEGTRGSQFTCYAFSYDPATGTLENLGPGWPQEGITAFDVDTDRGYAYAGSVPGVFFLVYELSSGRVWNAGQIKYTHPTRYMPMDPTDGKVYHFGEVTPAGRAFMTVWDPESFRLRDLEVVGDDGFVYTHSYATCCGPAGTKTLYGSSGDQLFEVNLEPAADGKLHARAVCSIGVDGDEKNTGMYAIERGPDGRIYWASSGGRNVPLDLFAYDPKSGTKTYLGACASQGDWIRGGQTQGICIDREGNMAVHMLYVEPNEKQRAHWKVADGFEYEDIEDKAHFKGYPGHIENTYYAVYYLKNVMAIH